MNLIRNDMLRRSLIVCSVLLMTGLAQKAVYASSNANIEVNLNVLDALEMMGKDQVQTDLSHKSTTKPQPSEISVRTKVSSDAFIATTPKRKPTQDVATFIPEPLRKPVDNLFHVAEESNFKRNSKTTLSHAIPVFRNKDAFNAEQSNQRASLIPQAKQKPVDQKPAVAAIGIGNVSNTKTKEVPNAKADGANQERIKRLEQLLNITRPDVEGNVIKKVIKNGQDQALDEAEGFDPMPSAVIPPAPPPSPVPAMEASNDGMVDVGEPPVPPVPPVPSLKSVTNLELLDKEASSTVRMSPKKLLQEKRLSLTPPLHSVVFDSENTHLSSDSKKRIEKILATIKEQNNGKKIRIVGYAQSSEDNSGTARRISLQRAIAVRNFMIRSGIDSSQIANVQARGDIAPADDEQNRVDILMVDENKS